MFQIGIAAGQTIFQRFQLQQCKHCVERGEITLCDTGKTPYELMWKHRGNDETSFLALTSKPTKNKSILFWGFTTKFRDSYNSIWIVSDRTCTDCAEILFEFQQNCTIENYNFWPWSVIRKVRCNWKLPSHSLTRVDGQQVY